MKKLYLSLTALLLSASMLAEQKQALVLSYGEGEEATIFLDTQPVITIADGQLVVTPALGEATQIPLSASLSYHVEMRDDIPDGLNAVGGVAISRQAGIVTVRGAKTIRLYSTSGALLVGTEGEAAIDLNRYATTSFILKVNNKTYKIAR